MKKNQPEDFFHVRHVKAVFFNFIWLRGLVMIFLIAALIFSAGYYSAPIVFTSLYFFALPILPLFRHFT